MMMMSMLSDGGGGGSHSRSATSRVLHEDATALVALLEPFAGLVASDCRDLQEMQEMARANGGEAAAAQMAASLSPETDWLAAQSELLARAAVSLARVRPVLDAHFSSLHETLSALVTARAALGPPVLRRLLSSWPRRDASREVTWLRLTHAVLLATPPAVVAAASHLREPLFRRLADSLASEHAGVARTAADFLATVAVLVHHVLPFPAAKEAILAALMHNRTHWSPSVRDASDDLYEQIMDLL
jgi:Protein phosphatase 2A regulatory B subunit (B56 family)